MSYRFSCFCSPEEIIEKWNHFFHECLVYFTSEPIKHGAFFQKVNDLFNFFNHYRLGQLCIFLCQSFGHVCVSVKWYISSKLSNLWAQNCSSYSFYFHFYPVGDNISANSNLCLPFFPGQPGQRLTNFDDVFKEPSFRFVDFILLMSCFQCQ